MVEEGDPIALEEAVEEVAAGRVNALLPAAVAGPDAVKGGSLKLRSLILGCVGRQHVL